MDFGVDAYSPTPPPGAGWGDCIWETGDSGVSGIGGVGIGRKFGGSGEARSSKVGDHKVSWVSRRDSCRLCPLLPGSDGGKDTGRGGTGRISRGQDTNELVSIVWAVDARKGRRLVTRFRGRLPLTEPLASSGEVGFGVVSAERPRNSMEIVKGREMREAKSRQWQGVYTVATTEVHCRNSNISTHEDNPWFFQHSAFPVSGIQGSSGGREQLMPWGQIGNRQTEPVALG